METLTIVLAHIVRFVHALYVAFVLSAPGLLLARRTLSIRIRRWIGWLHLGCVSFVVVQFLLNWSCPLSLLENALRGRETTITFVSLPSFHSSIWAVLLLCLGLYGIGLLVWLLAPTAKQFLRESL